MKKKMDNEKNKNPIRSIDVYNCYNIEGCDYKLVISRKRNPLSLYISKKQAISLIESLKNHGAKDECVIEQSILNLFNTNKFKDVISDIVQEKIWEHENEDSYS